MESCSGVLGTIWQRKLNAPTMLVLLDRPFLLNEMDDILFYNVFLCIYFFGTKFRRRLETENGKTFPHYRIKATIGNVLFPVPHPKGQDQLLLRNRETRASQLKS